MRYVAFLIYHFVNLMKGHCKTFIISNKFYNYESYLTKSNLVNFVNMLLLGNNKFNIILLNILCERQAVNYVTGN